MKITRHNVFLTVCFLFCALPLFAQSANQKSFVYVGTYTAKTQSKGIYLFEFSSATGKLEPQGVAAETTDPSWVAIHPNGKFLYAANEAGKASTVSAFSIDPKSGMLTLLNKLPSLGEDPCHLSFDRSGKYLFVANYTSGTVAAFPILPDGRLGEHTALLTDQGVTGTNKARQEGPHAHWIMPSADNHYVFVSDLGLDEILVYRFDASKGTLTPSDPSSVKLVPGTGPRHAVFARNAKSFYVAAELASTVTFFTFDPAHNSFQQQQVLSTLPPDAHGRNDVAEIAVDPTGKWLFVSNRGHDTIAEFSIDPATGKLLYLSEFSTEGHEPRHFAIDPSGKFILVENQNSNDIIEFQLDPISGKVFPTTTKVDVPSPVSAVFAATPR
jgi:6-phosphogluconolactonase